MPPPPLRVLGVNGSLRGPAGTSAAALRHALGLAEAAGHHARCIDLATWGHDDADTVEAMVDAITAADALIVATGTYWSGPSSLVQRWLEVLTFTEGSEVWRGKSAGVIVTMHGVGGLEVAQRLAGTLVLLGATVPGAGIIALAEPRDDPDADTWVLGDLATLVHNVLAIAESRPDLRHWPVDAHPPVGGRWPATGALRTSRDPDMRDAPGERPAR
jgi:NAD(P)H-dependent FMN reductase